ncbi:glycoside hydrolase superfamily [Chytriomyces sp. MP71]|nr:glycoside hydrolase superfamily [Chytriomyces sp. MP71]
MTENIPKQPEAFLSSENGMGEKVALRQSRKGGLNKFWAVTVTLAATVIAVTTVLAFKARHESQSASVDHKITSSSNVTSDTFAEATFKFTASSFQYRPYDPTKGPGVIGYWASWSQYRDATHTDDQVWPDLINWSKFSVLSYAFFGAHADGSVFELDAWGDQFGFKAVQAARANFPDLKLVASIGGWTGSGNFSNIAASDVTRKAFASSVKAFLDQNGFDGVDIDWEYPGGGGLPCNVVRPDDVTNFVALLQELRSQLGSDRLISIAASSNVNQYAIGDKNYIKDISNAVSYINVMTYDLYGPWSPTSDFNAPLRQPQSSDGLNEPLGSSNNVEYVMQSFTNSGVLFSKLTVGLPFYGRSWAVANGGNGGLYQECASAPTASGTCVAIQGDMTDVAEGNDPCGAKNGLSGTWSWRNLRTQPNAPLANEPGNGANGWIRTYYDSLASTGLYNPNYKGQATFIGIDDPQALYAKAKWSKNRNFGGVMIWEVDFDYKHELTTAVLAGWTA